MIIIIQNITIMEPNSQSNRPNNGISFDNESYDSEMDAEDFVNAHCQFADESMTGNL